MKRYYLIIIFYLISIGVSLLCAFLLFRLGGSFAEITGEEKSVIGMTFKAGGAVAGFIIIFWLSYIVMLRFEEKIKPQEFKISMKIYLHPENGNFDRRDSSYEATYLVYDTESGISRTYKSEVLWEAGYLTIIANELGDNDYLKVSVKNGGGLKWESDSFHTRSPKIEKMNLIL